MNTTGFFQVPPERWDAQLCARVARTRERDGYGTPVPWPGLRMDVKSGPVRYNGGCCRGGEWFPGEVHALPTVPAAFRWVRVPTWGWRLVRAEDPAR